MSDATAPAPAPADAPAPAPAPTPAPPAPAPAPADAPAPAPAAPAPAPAPADAPKPDAVVYEFTPPEGVELDAAKVDAFKAVLSKHGVSKEAAAEIFALGASQQVETAQVIKTALEAQSEKWAVDAKADKEIGGDKFDATLATASKAIDKFCTPEFKQYLNDTKLGNHPEMVRLMYRVGQAISEDGFVPNRGAAQGRPSTESVLYGSSSTSH